MRPPLRVSLVSLCVFLTAAHAARSPVIIIPGEHQVIALLTPTRWGSAPVPCCRHVCMLGVQGSLPRRWRRA